MGEARDAKGGGSEVVSSKGRSIEEWKLVGPGWNLDADSRGMQVLVSRESLVRESSPCHFVSIARQVMWRIHPSKLPEATSKGEAIRYDDNASGM